MSLRKRITKIAANIENNFDVLALEFRQRLRSDEPLQIVPYRTYGTIDRLTVKGRVLKDKRIRKSTDKDTVWNNLLSMYKRFESDEVPGARLKVVFEGKTYFTETDHEGYFSVSLSADAPIRWTHMWHTVALELVSAPFSSAAGLTSTAEVLVPPADAEYGIISDIDDTVIQTSATNLLAMSRNTFFHNAYTRLPFAGVSEFYNSLQLGRNGKRNNPFFYVSSSPWNLYDLLVDFLDLNKIPEGPLLLRDFGLDADKEIAGHMGHKFREIENILSTFPHLNFVLVGDSGQEDPKIYREVVSKFPGRILAIYIRDVQLASRERIAIDISRTLHTDNVEMIIVDNTIEAAEHAARHGLIPGDKISKIVEDKKRDKGELPGKQDLKLS